MKSILEREAKRIKIYSKILTINLQTNLSLSKLSKIQLNLLYQPLLPMKIDHWIQLEDKMIYSIVIKVNMLETLIRLVIFIKIGRRTITKEMEILVRLTLQLYNLTIFLFQTLGRELLQSTNQNIYNLVISKKHPQLLLAFQEFLLHSWISIPKSMPLDSLKIFSIMVQLLQFK